MRNHDRFLLGWWISGQAHCASLCDQSRMGPRGEVSQGLGADSSSFGQLVRDRGLEQDKRDFQTGRRISQLSGSSRRHRNRVPVRSVAGTDTRTIRLVIGLIVCCLNLRNLGVHAGVDIETAVMGSAICQCVVYHWLCRSIPCLGRGILASSSAVGGLRRDGNCRENGDGSGDIFFIVSRQKFHVVEPPRNFEMTDDGFSIGGNRCQTCFMHQAAIRLWGEPVRHFPQSACDCIS